MKKLISLVLCIMMISSLFAMNASASVAIGDMPETAYPINQSFEDADNLMFTTIAWKNGSGAVAVETVDDNSFADIYLGGKLDTTLDIAYIGSGNLDGAVPNKGYTMAFDVYPVDTSVSLRVLYNSDTTTNQNARYGIAIPASAFPTMNQWYSVKMVVAENYVNPEVSISVYVKSAVDSDYTKIAHTGLYSPVMLSGHTFFIGAETRYNVNNSETVDNTRYKIDNVVLYYRTAQSEYPSTGVIAYENYEGTTQSLKGQKATVAGDLENYYLTVLNDEDADDDRIAGTFAGSTMWAIERVPENFIITFDICQNAGNEQNFNLEYYDEKNTSVKVKDHWGQLYVTADKCEVGKWYRAKVHVNCGVVKTLSFVDLETGDSVEGVAFGRGTTDITTSKNSLIVRPFNNQGIFNWSLDNIVLTEAAAASLPEINATADEVAVTVSADAISETVAPVLALYKENRLVDIDWDTKDNTVEGVSAELTATGEYDEAVVFIWDGFENCTPLMATPWNITDIIAE